MAFDASRSDAVSAVTSIYAQVGHTAGADEFNDMDNRIRNGQTLAELVANTYDDAQRRFVASDGRDAQSNSGRQYDPPAVMLEQLAAPAREQAAMMNGAPSVVAQRSTPSNTPRYNVGPAADNFGAAVGGGLGGLSMGTILMLGGAALVAFVLFRKAGRK